MYFPKRNKITNDKIITLKKGIKQKKGWKPNGIWYSCGNMWYNFITENDMTDRLYKYIHVIRLKNNKKTTYQNKDSNKLLLIKNINDFDNFFNEYKVFSDKLNHYLIDWVKVKKDYGGIEICPYLHERRFTEWYYLWDVASGCIWNNDIISSTNIIYEKNKDNTDVKYIKYLKND